MGIQSGSASGLHLVFTEQAGQCLTFLAPIVGRDSREDLGDAAPADIADERALLLNCRFAFLRFDPVEGFNSGEVVPKFLLEGTAPDFIRGLDSIIADVLVYVSSGGSRIYLSRTISQAVSWACCGL